MWLEDPDVVNLASLNDSVVLCQIRRTRGRTASFRRVIGRFEVTLVLICARQIQVRVASAGRQSQG